VKQEEGESENLREGGWGGGSGMLGGGGDGTECGGATRGACHISRRSETPGLLCARCWPVTVTATGRDGAPVKRIIEAFAITLAIRAELARLY
jgi:hypothetical protein